MLYLKKKNNNLAETEEVASTLADSLEHIMVFHHGISGLTTSETLTQTTVPQKTPASSSSLAASTTVRGLSAKQWRQRAKYFSNISERAGHNLH